MGLRGPGRATATLAALQVLAVMVESGEKASTACRMFAPLPQKLKSVRYHAGAPLEEADVRAAIAQAEAELARTGRLLIRKSGTEPVIRVMAEGEDDAQVARVVDGLCALIASVAERLRADEPVG